MKFVLPCFVFVMQLLPQTANSADQKDGPVYTSLSEVDSDYHFQGEYRGWQRSTPSSRSSESVAIQVIALGNGQFAASKYYGGLPGEGWFGGDRFELQGEMLGDIVVLRGASYDIEVDGESAVILAKDGRQAGILEKWHRVSPTMGAKPPAGAIVLFDGFRNGSFQRSDDDRRRSVVGRHGNKFELQRLSFACRVSVAIQTDGTRSGTRKQWLLFAKPLRSPGLGLIWP